MKRKITIKPEADADLMKIWIYGYWNFGEQLADAYNLKFSQLFDKIALFDLGRKRPDLGLSNLFTFLRSAHCDLPC